MSRFDEACGRVIAKAKAAGYSAINIDYAGPRIGKNAKGYEVSGKHDNGVRVIIARASSWDRCYEEAMEYLA